MKHIHIQLDDVDYKRLMKTKKLKTWRQLLLESGKGRPPNKGNGEL